ncbi:hypothetical protein GCM10011611_37690 [Aliidongia dinghuensis]|uniref:DUF5658 domain-containing protein n=1 Tax=Aliidongia dinghuensis TaxID=1867774 RepID=A0A8J2YWI9_9PROT|nr:DUF5658 family protein [Aliidongia dinghuensis]GGF28122.1 hypothetical protein GCM10011611_37690 [Aliidongia dinghuensis]
MKKFAVIAALVALQIADVLSTNAALAAPGIVEANPVMAWCQGALGALWWLPKVAVVAFVAYAVLRLERLHARWLTAGMIGLYCAVVASNVLNAF